MSMSKELLERQGEKPDRWTLAWWSSQFQEVLKSNNGLKHALHLALADNEDLGKQVSLLQEQVRTLESDAVIDRAKIGELQAMVAGFIEENQALKARVDRQGEFLNTLKKGAK